MVRAYKHTAIWKGVEHTLSIQGWYRLTGYSCTFLKKHMDIADSEGMPFHKLMQHAIEQVPDRKRNIRATKKKRRHPEQVNKDRDSETSIAYHKVLMRMAIRP